MTQAIGRGLLAVFFLLAGATSARAQFMSAELMGGSAYNVPTPLTVRQSGFDDIHFTAHYDTKPFGPFAPYYSWRVDFWNAAHDRGWEIQQVHHRIFLSNTTPEVTSFAIHFGYNYFMVGRAWRMHKFMLHTDFGVLVPNPANTVRGLSINIGPNAVHTGYSLSGVGGQLAISRQLDLFKHFHVLADGGFMLGHTTVPVVNGNASVPNVSIHGRLGFGVSF
jgi:hypothetical protein